VGKLIRKGAFGYRINIAREESGMERVQLKHSKI
jgi:hypothetical protein